MLKTLRGSIPFNSPSDDLGGFVEVVTPDAFDRSLASGRDVLARTEHDSRLLLGRRATGTLRLKLEASALKYEVDVPDTHAGRDVAQLVERGDLYQSSFAFYVPDPKKGERWSVRPDGTMLRELLDVELVDVAPVSQPAYPAATVGRADPTPSPVAQSINHNRLRLAER